MAEETKEVATKAKAVKKAPAKKAAASKAPVEKKAAAPKKAAAKKTVAKKEVKEEVKTEVKPEVKAEVKEETAPKAAKAAPKKEEAKVEAKELPSFKTRKANIKDFDIILGPIVTEKTQALQTSNNTMTFKVRSDATASMIKSAVQAVFGVKVDKVNIVNVRPRDKRSTKYAGTIPGFKKAYVKINKGYNLGEIAKASQSEVK